MCTLADGRDRPRRHPHPPPKYPKISYRASNTLCWQFSERLTEEIQKAHSTEMMSPHRQEGKKQRAIKSDARIRGKLLEGAGGS